MINRDSKYRDTSHMVVEGNTCVYRGSQSGCEGYVIMNYYPAEQTYCGVKIVDRRVK